jgi:hypothetical protein
VVASRNAPGAQVELNLLELEVPMRSFISACIAASLIAVGAAVILDSVVQESAATAFSTSGVRLSH